MACKATALPTELYPHTLQHKTHVNSAVWHLPHSCFYVSGNTDIPKSRRLEYRYRSLFVEMAGLEPANETEPTKSVVRFALPLRHISMYYRLSRCVKTRLIFTIYGGIKPLALCRMTAPKFNRCPVVPNHRRKATRCLDTVSWSTSPSSIIPLLTGGDGIIFVNFYIQSI